jgi:large repetitive protein
MHGTGPDEIRDIAHPARDCRSCTPRLHLVQLSSLRRPQLVTSIVSSRLHTVKFVVYQTSDANYAGLESAPIEFKNVDNDTATVYATRDGTSMTEAGGTVTLGLRLGAKPTGDVTIDIATTNPTEAIVSPASLVFTPDNYNVPQNVTVTGQDDTIDDGDVQYDVNVTSSQSSDPKFSGLDVFLTRLKNIDND